LVLADYQQDVTDIAYAAGKRFGHVEVRPHPADTDRKLIDIKSAIRLRDVVICSSSTAGFEAIIQGAPTICLDPKNEIAPVCSASIDADLYVGDRAQWLHEMSYKQWSLDEIASGEAWEHLKDAE
jgi:hypothetical protein